VIGGREDHDGCDKDALSAYGRCQVRSAEKLDIGEFMNGDCEGWGPRRRGIVKALEWIVSLTRDKSRYIGWLIELARAPCALSQGRQARCSDRYLGMQARRKRTRQRNPWRLGLGRRDRSKDEQQVVQELHG